MTIEKAIANCNAGQPPTVKQLIEYFDDMSEKTLRGWIKKFGYMIDKNDHTVIKCDENINAHDHKSYGQEQMLTTTILLRNIHSLHSRHARTVGDHFEKCGLPYRA